MLTGGGEGEGLSGFCSNLTIFGYLYLLNELI